MVAGTGDTCRELLFPVEALSGGGGGTSNIEQKAARIALIFALVLLSSATKDLAFERL